MLRERERLFSEEDLGQGWQTFLRMLARIIRKLRRNLFACQREFWRARSWESSIHYY